MSEFTITNNDNGYKYLGKAVQSWNPIRVQQSTDFTLPESTPQENQIIRLDGQREETAMTFIIWDDGTDRSDGTWTEPAITKIKQKQFLRELFTAGLSVDYTLVETEDYPTGIAGTIEDLRFNRVPGIGKNMEECTITFLVGSVI